MFSKILIRPLIQSRSSLLASAKNATKMTLRQQFFAPATTSRLFSTQVEKGSAKLLKALDKEIKYENENYTQLEDMDTFLKENGFEFEESDTNVQMKLSKKVGAKTIEIYFDSRQPLPEDDFGQEENQENQEEEHQGMTENYSDFTIFLLEDGSNQGIIVEATTMDTEISFNTVAITKNIAEERKKHRFERQLTSYPGPEFSTLDERIQTAFTEMLAGYGVNEHLAAFVECMSLDKDQRLYMKWLGELHDFVQN